MKIGFITYDINHLKTQQVIDRICNNDTEDEYILYVLPFKKRKARDVYFHHRPNQIVGDTPEVLAKRYSIELVYCDTDADIDARCDYYLITGAGILSNKAVNGKRIINCHPGIIPTVRGLDAFKWAIYDSLPIGNTLHFIDEQVDAGEVISVLETKLFSSDTLESFASRHYENEIMLLADFKNRLRNQEIKGSYEKKDARMRMPKNLEMNLYSRFDMYKESYSE